LAESYLAYWPFRWDYSCNLEGAGIIQMNADRAGHGDSSAVP
jgi:hypothetical protein